MYYVGFGCIEVCCCVVMMFECVGLNVYYLLCYLYEFFGG